jgi:hypothetical protein
MTMAIMIESEWIGNELVCTVTEIDDELLS